MILFCFASESNNTTFLIYKVIIKPEKIKSYFSEKIKSYFYLYFAHIRDLLKMS